MLANTVLAPRCTLYPTLLDNEIVKKSPPVRGMAKSVFFLDHRHDDSSIHSRTSRSSRFPGRRLDTGSDRLFGLSYAKEESTGSLLLDENLQQFFQATISSKDSWGMLLPRFMRTARGSYEKNAADPI